MRVHIGANSGTFVHSCVVDLTRRPHIRRWPYQWCFSWVCMGYADGKDNWSDCAAAGETPAAAYTNWKRMVQEHA